MITLASRVLTMEGFGDCFSDALTHRQRLPLLFVGNYFSRTDLQAAL